MSLSAEMMRNNEAPADGALALEVSGLTKVFVHHGSLFQKEARTIALSDVSLDVRPSEILAIVGESGSGKTTLGRIVVGLEHPDAGRIRAGETVLLDTEQRIQVPAAKRGIGMIFQDPNSSLNPRMTISEIVGEGLRLAGVGRQEIRERAAAALSMVGLRKEDLERHPHQFSGGQRQRIGIARAIVLEPRILIADEAVSSLDVSVQMQVLNVILDIRDKLGLAVIFITHNIGVVDYLCDRVVVLSNGKVVEHGGTREVIDTPQHPYTQRLLNSVTRL